MIKEFENGDILIYGKGEASPRILITIRLDKDGCWHLYKEICIIADRRQAIEEAKNTARLMKLGED